jgi:hypothetical protein
VRPTTPSANPNQNAKQQQQAQAGFTQAQQRFTEAQPKLDGVYSHILAILGSTTESGDWGHQLNAMFQRQEAQLTRVDSQLEGIVKDLRNRQAELELEYASTRRKIEEEAQTKLATDRQKLEAEIAELRASIDRDLEVRTSALDRRTLEVEAREKTADHTDNRAARRKLREELLKILASRNTKFGLTSDTENKRKPVMRTASAVAVFFATILATAIFAPSSIVTMEPWPKIAAEITAALGFAGATVFLLRFHQQWAKRHADEEFYLKRLELDFERASWLVEMSLEYAAERGTPIPGEMFERLSRGLFGVEASPDVRHPMEALLGAASEAQVKLPNATLRVKRRGLQRLAEESQTPEATAENQ